MAYIFNPFTGQFEKSSGGGGVSPVASITGTYDNTEKKLSFYVPTSGGRYILVNFVRTTIGETGGLQEHIDIYSMSTLYMCDSSKAVLYPITNSGAWECAIKEDGAADFIGSVAHGDDILSSYGLWIDGIYYDDEDDFPTEFSCTRIKFNQTSKLYDEGANLVGEFADATRMWEFYAENNRSVIEIDSHIEMLRDATLNDVYLSMMPLLRTSGSDQISDTAVRITDGSVTLVEDVTNSGFTTVLDKSDTVFMSCAENSIAVEASVTNGWDNISTRTFNVSPSASYNKLYWDYAGNGYSAADGERFGGKLTVKIG